MDGRSRDVRCYWWRLCFGFGQSGLADYVDDRLPTDDWRQIRSLNWRVTGDYFGGRTKQFSTSDLAHADGNRCGVHDGSHGRWWSGVYQSSPDLTLQDRVQDGDRHVDFDHGIGRHSGSHYALGSRLRGHRLCSGYRRGFHTRGVHRECVRQSSFVSTRQTLAWRLSYRHSDRIAGAYVSGKVEHLIELVARFIRIPFRFRYGHARKQHQGLDAIVCHARDEDGRVGWGEAVPRTYVTGETCESVMAAIPLLLDRLPSSANGDAFLNARQQLSDSWSGTFPSCALCAIDTALADLSGQQAQQSAAQWLGATSTTPLMYSASIGMSKKTKLIATLLLYRALGIKEFKVKVSGLEDIERVRLIRRILGRDTKLFADANANWDRETAIRCIEALERHGVWAVEEPLRSPESSVGADGDVDRFAALTDSHYENYCWLRQRSPLPLIADESLICLGTANRIVESSAFDILNIRLSKCGGPWMSTLMVNLARKNNLRFAFGAMVGETPILATAGAHFAALYRDHLYVQGFSHRLLHGRRFASGEPTMKRGGRVQIDSAQFGWGLSVDHQRLDSLTVRSESFRI